MSLTIACVFVKANVPYTVEYVANLKAMVARHLTRPHRFVCLTDRPWLLPSWIESVPIPSPGKLAGWWSKIHLHNPDIVTGDRVVAIDLDTVIVGDLSPIVDFPAPVALVPHAGTFNGKHGLAVVKRFNSSVMVWDRRATARVATEWSPVTASRLWGDQDFIGELYPEAATMPASWFPRLSDLAGHAPGPDTRVVLSKVPKNHIAADLYPWVADAWRAA